MFEIVYPEGCTSKLTIAKDRVTLKINPAGKLMERRLMLFAKYVADSMGSVYVTHRGQIKLHNEFLQVTMTIGKPARDVELFKEGPCTKP